MTTRRSVFGAALATALTGAGCGRPVPLPVATPVAAAPSFGGTDRAWLEITIAMNEAVRPLLELAPARARDPRLRAVAAELTAFHQGELAELRKLHRLAGLPAQNPHDGMRMPGMVTADHVAEAAKASGAAFDRLLVRLLRAHLDQGVRLAAGEQTSGAETRTRDLADRGNAERKRFLTALEIFPG